MLTSKAQKPAERIQELFNERRSRSDDEVLAELTAMPVLPDEDDLAWADEETWHQAELFIALADIAAARRLRAALPLLLERACFGDPGEMMRGLRHNLEAIADPDWHLLTDVCMRAAKFPQRGARFWAVNELGILRDKRALPVLEEALRDEVQDIRSAAQAIIVFLSNAE